MKDSEADIAIDVLNKLIAQELEAVERRDMRFGNTTPSTESASDSIPRLHQCQGQDSGRRSPMPWRSGMLGTRSSVSVMSWSRRICTRAICVAGGCPSPVYAVHIASSMAIRRRHSLGGVRRLHVAVEVPARSGPSRWMPTVFSSSGACPNRRPVNERPDSASVPERSRHSHLRQQWHRTIPGCRPAYRALRHLRQVVEESTAVSPYLTIWVEVPAWMIWLFWHRIWKTDHKSSHPGKEPEP